MRSIRLSLAVYFLALLALALAAVSVLAYRNTEHVLGDKEAIRRAMLSGQFDRDRKAEEVKLDRALSWQGNGFIYAAQISYRTHTRPHHVSAPFGVLSIGLAPTGLLVAPVWLASGSGPLADSLFRDFVAEFHYEGGGAAVHPPPERQPTEYFQINFEGNALWKSGTLGANTLPFDRAAFGKMEFGPPQFEDIQLESGIRVRRIMMKATFARFFPGPPRRGMPGPTRPGMQGPTRDGSRRTFGRDTNERASPVVLFQCGVDTSHRDARLAELQTNLDADLLNLKLESKTTLANLGKRLLLINLVTFATVIVGGYWLVRLGLSPLQRLSEAVSLVSARDFRLPFDEPKLPAELRPIVERLTETLNLLKRAFAREKQAAADISHELRTPLAALLTTIEVALRKPRPPEEYREVLADCHATGQQMNHLVERLLALARMDAGVDTMRPRSVEVTALAEQCATMVRPLAEARGLRLSVHRNNPIQLQADADKLREVINNLLHNAIEYNQPNGSVDLSIERQNGTLQLEVRDTGIGIAPEEREHIFERFYRADRSRHAEGMHAGLGLAIVKGYVDLMGGTITVQSTQGKGSTFRLELPIQGNAPGLVEHKR